MMSDADPFWVSAYERGVVRIFTTDLDPEGGAAITAENVHRLLGAELDLDVRGIEVFPSKAIEAIGLAGYLTQGYGIPEEDLKGREAALDALKGLVVLVASRAFDGKETSLEPNPALRFVGLFSEPGMDPPVKMQKPEAAKGTLEPVIKATTTRRAPSHWVLPFGALLLAAALVIFLVL